MERLKAMKERLMTCVESQMGDLSQTNAEELGEVVDMIKDLEETIYYASVVKAMEDRKEESRDVRERRQHPLHPQFHRPSQTQVLGAQGPCEPV